MKINNIIRLRKSMLSYGTEGSRLADIGGGGGFRGGGGGGWGKPQFGRIYLVSLRGG